jgi:hypothetical protein
MTVMKKDDVASDFQLARKHVAALSALTVHPGYMPVDGLCLEELCRWGLIQRVPRGYALTAHGDAALAAEEAVLRKRAGIVDMAPGRPSIRRYQWQDLESRRQAAE